MSNYDFMVKNATEEEVACISLCKTLRLHNIIGQLSCSKKAMQAWVNSSSFTPDKANAKSAFSVWLVSPYNEKDWEG